MGIRKLDFVTKTQFLSVQKLVNTSNQNTSVINSYFNTDLRVDRPLSYASKQKFANFILDNKAGNRVQDKRALHLRKKSIDFEKF